MIVYARIYVAVLFLTFDKANTLDHTGAITVRYNYGNNLSIANAIRELDDVCIFDERDQRCTDGGRKNCLFIKDTYWKSSRFEAWLEKKTT